MKRETIAKLFGETWVDLLAPFIQSPEWDNIIKQLAEEKQKSKEKNLRIFPDQTQLFRAFKELPFPNVRVVLMGMDPYPVEGYANGWAFAHSMDKKVSASLEKIIDAIEVDCHNGLEFDKNKFDCELKHWNEQGILLLNTALTVEEKNPGSHMEIWKPFMIHVIKQLNNFRNDLIFLAWGKPAQTLTENIHFVKHFTMSCEHPSNAAREKRVWKCNHFSATNAIIIGNQLGEPIKWMQK